MNDYIYSEKIMQLIRKKKSLLCLTEINDLLNTFFPKYNTYQMKHAVNQTAQGFHVSMILSNLMQRVGNWGQSWTVALILHPII